MVRPGSDCAHNKRQGCCIPDTILFGEDHRFTRAREPVDNELVGENMTESELRDLIAKDISVIEAGLILLDKEHYIPNPLGTRSFIDLYAKDLVGHHVLIELKKSDASAREALHEIHKYVEGVKQHLGVRDEEIRIILASTEWGELLVPFSRLAADTNLAIIGLQVEVDDKIKTVTTSPAPILSFSRGRFITPWHDVNWYIDQDSLNKGIASIEACCRAKEIEDYIIVVLRPPQPVHSEHQAAMRTTLLQMAELQGMATIKEPRELPLYEFIAYFAMQALTVDQYLQILARDSGQIKEISDKVDGMEAEEALQFLQESVTALEPRPENDHYEIGYPAKLTKFLNELECQTLSVRRYGMFARNGVLDDESIISELMGEDGSTGQRFSRTLSIYNRAHLASARSDIAACLEQNPVWKNHILRALDEILHEFPEAEVDVSIYNPATGVLTFYFPTTRDDGFLYVPTYSLIVRNPEPTRMYYGGLQADGSPLSFRQILNKYYQGDLFGLLLTMTWGGRESRDLDIMENMGAAYRSFRCDVEGEKRDFFLLRDERWRPCDPVDIFTLFKEYLEKNEKLVRQIVIKVGNRSDGGTFDASSIERQLDDAADLDYGKKLEQFFVGAPEECDLCGCLLSEEKYMIDGKIKDTAAWGCICADCYGFNGEGIGWGIGQLYLRQEDDWLLVAGFPPPDDVDEM